jgi:hypothetical protein
MAKCRVPPAGWTREGGHDGPCAALPDSTGRAPEWHCMFCNYGEYIVENDWKRALERRDEHEKHCDARPLFVSPFPEPTVVVNDDPLMAEAWDLTTRDRHNQYGTAESAFRAYGHIWTGLLQHKLESGAVIDASDVCLMMTGLKIAREVRNTKRDNVVDAHGYLSLLSRIRGWVSHR